MHEQQIRWHTVWDEVASVVRVEHGKGKGLSSRELQGSLWFLSVGNGTKAGSWQSR